MHNRPDRETLERAEVQLERIAAKITTMLPHGWGFFLCLASAGHGGYATYVSDIERDSGIKLLRETADRLEREGPSAS